MPRSIKCVDLHECAEAGSKKGLSIFAALAFLFQPLSLARNDQGCFPAAYHLYQNGHCLAFGRSLRS